MPDVPVPNTRPTAARTDAAMTLCGVTMPCPQTVLRIFDTLLVLDCFPANIGVRRGRASFRFHADLRAGDVPIERLGERLRAIVGVRAVALRPGSGAQLRPGPAPRPALVPPSADAIGDRRE